MKNAYKLEIPMYIVGINMAMPETEKCCECYDDSYLRRRLDDAYKDREKLRKMIRVILAIMIDKKLIGEETAKAFMESKETKEISPEQLDKLIKWAEAKKWIQKAGIKKGALRSQLGIKEGETIPKSLLRRIVKAEIGTKIKGITVTAQLKKRASLALSLGKMKK